MQALGVFARGGRVGVGTQRGNETIAKARLDAWRRFIGLMPARNGRNIGVNIWYPETMETTGTLRQVYGTLEQDASIDIPEAASSATLRQPPFQLYASKERQAWPSQNPFRLLLYPTEVGVSQLGTFQVRVWSKRMNGASSPPSRRVRRPW